MQARIPVLLFALLALLNLLACGDNQPPAEVPPATEQQLTTEDFVSDLTSPCSLAFHNDGLLFVTERSGRLRVV